MIYNGSKSHNFLIFRPSIVNLNSLFISVHYPKICNSALIMNTVIFYDINSVFVFSITDNWTFFYYRHSKTCLSTGHKSIQILFHLLICHEFWTLNKNFYHAPKIVMGVRNKHWAGIAIKARQYIIIHYYPSNLKHSQS